MCHHMGKAAPLNRQWERARCTTVDELAHLRCNEQKNANSCRCRRRAQPAAAAFTGRLWLRRHEQPLLPACNAVFQGVGWQLGGEAALPSHRRRHRSTHVPSSCRTPIVPTHPPRSRARTHSSAPTRPAPCACGPHLSAAINCLCSARQQSGRRAPYHRRCAANTPQQHPHTRRQHARACADQSHPPTEHPQCVYMRPHSSHTASKASLSATRSVTTRVNTIRLWRGGAACCVLAAAGRRARHPAVPP